MRNDDVYHATLLIWRHPECGVKCQLTAKLAEVTRMHEEATAIQERLQRMMGGMDEMSQALWCDTGDHPFSAKKPGRKRYTQTSIENGEEISEILDVCGEHALIQRKAEPRALSSDEYDLKGP